MKSFKITIDPENIARTFTNYVRAILKIIFWSFICLASIAAAFIAVSGLWVFIKYFMKILGF